MRLEAEGGKWKCEQWGLQRGMCLSSSFSYLADILMCAEVFEGKLINAF